MVSDHPTKNRMLDLGELDEGVIERFGRLVGLIRNERDTHRTIERAVAEHVERVSSERHALDLTPFDITKSHSTVRRDGLRDLNRSARRVVLRSLPLLLGGGVLSMAYALLTGPQPASYVSSEGLHIWFAHILQNLRNVYVPTIAIVVLIATTTYVTQLVRIFKASRTRSAQEALAADCRPPVLLIRSFSDDMAMIYNVEYRSDHEGNLVPDIATSRFEPALVPHLSKFGPMIAVGKPGEVFPAGGAARVHFANEVWQQPVVAMIEQARIIVLVAGLDPSKTGSDLRMLSGAELIEALALSPGVRWEIEYIRNHDYIGKLLVLLKPPPVSAWGDFLEWLLAWSARAKAARAKKLRERHLIAIRPSPDGGADLIRTGKPIHSTRLYECAIRLGYYRMFCSS